MEIELKDTLYITDGNETFSKDIMNDLLRYSLKFKYAEYKKKPVFVEINNQANQKKTIFSFYNDITYTFVKNRATGAYYKWFIYEYPLNDYADNQGNYAVYGPKLWTNEKFNNKSVKCWAYDINSAYPAALIKPIPDVNNPLGEGWIEEGQVGFNLDKEGILVEVFDGLAMWRFNLIESPWAKKYIPEKFADLLRYKKLGDVESAKKVKDCFVQSIGVLRKHNAFLYTHILTTCRRTIEQYVDEDTTIMVNTDCIYSAVPRPDIPLGKEIGLFKELEQNGTNIYISGANYAWEDGETSIRGVPKELQATYDLKTKTQIKKPDYIMEGYKIYDARREEISAGGCISQIESLCKE